MKDKLNEILLVDDNIDCNFFLKKLLDENEVANQIAIAYDGEAALDFLTQPANGQHHNPSLIFLDINMPRMNGWEFLEDYENLPAERKAQMHVIMLTSSINPDDEKRALANPNVEGFYQKFLDKPHLDEILNRFFSE